MSKDDQYWHGIMHALGDEFMDMARGAVNPAVAGAWASASKEVKATADQALETAGTAERLVSSKPN